MNIKNIVNSIDIKNDIATMNIYGDIVSSESDTWYDDDISPEFVSKFLNDTKGKELHVHINSGGGSVFAGIAIYNLLRAREDKTITYVDALAASAASVIALAGDEMRMPTGSMLMIHKPWSPVAGNADELRKMADDLDLITESLMDIYKNALVDDEEIDKVREMVNAETWLSVEDCKSLFANTVAESTLTAAACIRGESMKHYKMPKGLKFNDERKHKLDNDELEKMKMEIELELY